MNIDLTIVDKEVMILQRQVDWAFSRYGAIVLPGVRKKVYPRNLE